MNGEIPKLLKIGEVADVLRISRAKVYNLIIQGKLPAIRVSERRLVIAEDDLGRYIERQRANHPSQLIFMLDGLLEDPNERAIRPIADS